VTTVRPNHEITGWKEERASMLAICFFPSGRCGEQEEAIRKGRAYSNDQPGSTALSL